MPSNTQETVFLIHHGCQNYLRIAAEYINKSGNRSILIGNDEITGKRCDLYIEDKLISLPHYEAFERNYVHMSSATPEFELLCFKRYFYLYEIAKKFELNHFWLIDSDVILTSNLSEISRHPLIKACNAAISTPYQDEYTQASSPHCSYWTLKGLEQFIQFLSSLYQGNTKEILNKKYTHHLKHGIPGGICDMTALYLWQKNNISIFNLAQAHLHGLPVFDNNLNQAGNCLDNEFAMVSNVRLKKVTSHHSQYQVYISKSNQAISVAALHFQGTAKVYMATFQHKHEITYWGYAPYTFKQYVTKRIKSLQRKLKILSRFSSE